MYKDLSFEEKYRFAKKTTTQEVRSEIKKLRTNIIVGVISNVVLVPVAVIIILAVTKVKLSFLLDNPFYLIMIGLFEVLTLTLSTIRDVRKMHKPIKDASNGKVSYKEYGDLLNSGELDRIIQEYEKLEEEKKQAEAQRLAEEAIKAEAQKQAENTVTLSAEEYAAFKKLVAEKEQKEPENKTE